MSSKKKRKKHQKKHEKKHEKKPGPVARLSSADDRLKAAIEMHKQGRPAEAARIYREILAGLPDHVDALHFLGVAEHQLGQSEKALAHIGRAVELAPDHPDARINRGNIFKALGRLAEAEADYRQALLVRPSDRNILQSLGAIQRQREDFAAAVETFRRLVTLDPNHLWAWQQLGAALHALDRIDDAIPAYREVLRLAPTSYDYYPRLGILLYKKGLVLDAAEVYRQCLAHFPDDAHARHLLAACSGKDVPARASDEYVRAEFDDFAAGFEQNLAQLEYRAPILIEEELARIFGPPEPRLDVLDAGCGTGLCAPFLRPRASRLVGVDLSGAMIELARKRGLFDELVVEELTAFLRRNERTSDLIVSADTLVYFGVLGEVLEASAKALRPGGVLIFTLERAHSEEAPAGFFLGPHGRYSHAFDYVRGALAEAGFAEPIVREVVLRKEAGEWVPGWLCSARRGTAGARSDFAM